MGNVKIITDSTADIPKSLAKELDITVIPINVHLDGESYQDGINITPDEFYLKMSRTDQLPTTSQPSPLDIVSAFKRAVFDGAKEIISFHISSRMSGTYQSALLAKSMVEEEYPDVKIEVVDTKTVTYCLGVIVVLVARAAKEGKPFSELLSMAMKIRQEQRLLALVDTLEYLQKGGRIGKAAAFVGTLLNIKPIITVNDDGEVEAVDKARGNKKAVQKVFDGLKKKASGRPVALAVIHAAKREQAEQWMARAQELFDIREQHVVDIGPAVGTHAGPGTIGCIIVPLDRL